MNHKELFDKWFAAYYGPPSPLIIHSGGHWHGKSYVIDPKAMKATDLSVSNNMLPPVSAPQLQQQAYSFWARDPRKAFTAFDLFYGTADPLQGTPWGAVADRFEEAVAAAGTELEWW